MTQFPPVLDNLQAFRAPSGLLNLNHRTQRGQKPWTLFQGPPSFNLSCILSLKPETKPCSPSWVERTFLGPLKKPQEKLVPSEMEGKKMVLITMMQYVYFFPRPFFDRTDLGSFFSDSMLNNSFVHSILIPPLLLAINPLLWLWMFKLLLALQTFLQLLSRRRS